MLPQKMKIHHCTHTIPVTYNKQTVITANLIFLWNKDVNWNTHWACQTRESLSPANHQKREMASPVLNNFWLSDHCFIDSPCRSRAVTPTLFTRTSPSNSSYRKNRTNSLIVLDWEKKMGALEWMEYVGVQWCLRIQSNVSQGLEIIILVFFSQVRDKEHMSSII